MNNFCASTANIWKFVGIIVYAIKIIIPLIIVVMAMKDLGSSAVKGDDKEIKGGAVKLVKRVIAGAFIFLIPSAVKIIFFSLTQFNSEMQNNTANCINCITDPKSCDTSQVGQGILKK